VWLWGDSIWFDLIQSGNGNGKAFDGMFVSDSCGFKQVHRKKVAWWDCHGLFGCLAVRLNQIGTADDNWLALTNYIRRQSSTVGAKPPSSFLATIGRTSPSFPTCPTSSIITALAQNGTEPGKSRRTHEAFRSQSRLHRFNKAGSRRNTSVATYKQRSHSGISLRILRHRLWRCGAAESTEIAAAAAER